MQTTNINIPQTPLLGPGGTVANEWLQWFISPDHYSVTIKKPLATGSGGVGTNQTPENGQVLIGSGSQYAVGSVGQGTGITVNAGAGSLSVALSNTTVTAGDYGAADHTVVFTVNAQGQLTHALSTLIEIDHTQVAGLGTMALQDASAVNITGGTIAIGAFGANGTSPQTAYASGGAVASTPSTLVAYGYTQTQADGIVTLLNNIRAALVANGIMS